MVTNKQQHVSQRSELDPVNRLREGGRFLWLIRGDEGYGFRRAHLGMAQELMYHSIEIGFAAIQPGAFADEVAAAGYPLWVLGQKRRPDQIRQRGWRFVVGGLRVCGSALINRGDVCAAIRSFRPDWLHISINSLLIVGGSAARAMGIPAYWHLHNTVQSKLPFGLQALCYRSICAALSVRTMANSKHTAASLGARFGATSVLYPGVDVSHFSPEADFPSQTRASLGVDPDLPLFLIAARLVPEKAQDRVVEAALALIEVGHRFSLVLVGGPTTDPYAASIQARINRARAGDRVRLLGPVVDPRPYFRAADVVINSRLGSEPFGLSLVEAMLLERPVLAYGLGGPSETVVDGVTGWLVATPSVESYRRGIERALFDRDRWTAMGEAGRRFATPRFSLQATAERYLRIVGRGDIAESSADATLSQANPRFAQ